MIIQLKRYGNKLVLHYIRTADIQIRKMLADPHHNFKEFIVHFILIFRKEICQKKRNRREASTVNLTMRPHMQVSDCP